MADAQLTDKIDPMYIISNDRPEPHDDAHVICFFGVFPILATRGQKTVFFGSSSAHRQDGPHVYYTKMTGYLIFLKLF